MLRDVDYLSAVLATVMTGNLTRETCKIQVTAGETAFLNALYALEKWK